MKGRVRETRLLCLRLKAAMHFIAYHREKRNRFSRFGLRLGQARETARREVEES